MSKKIETILKEVLNERIRQNEKWGEQNHSLTTWIAILTEEVGEAAKEAVDFECLNPIAGRRPDLSQQHQRATNYREELIQVAAVAVQMVESIDRNELSNIEANLIFTNS